MTAADPRRWMWAEACAMIERAEQLHRQFFQPGFAEGRRRIGSRRVDIFATEGSLTIIAALPGVEPQDIDISIEPDLLRVAGDAAAARGRARHGDPRLEIPSWSLRTKYPAARGTMGTRAIDARERLFTSQLD